MNKKKLWLIIGGVVIVGAIIVLNFTSDSKQKTEVNAQTVARQDLTETVSASGRIQPKSKVNITAEVSGKVIALPVKEGDTVRAGDLLVLIDTIQAKSDLDQARFSLNEISARMTGAKTDLEQAEREFNRQKQLFEGKLSSETDFDNARFAFEAAKSSYEATSASAKQTQARFEKSQDNLKKTRISSPMNGIITFVDVEVGEIAAAQTAFTQGKTLLTISNLNIFEVEVEVDETEVAKVDLGQRAEISVDAFPDTTFPGEVVEIGNTAIIEGLGSQDQSTNFKVTVVFQGTDVKVRPGMSATVDITTASRDEVSTVPYAAVVVRSFDMDSLNAARQAQETGSGGVNTVHAAETTGDTTTKANEEKKELKGVFVIKEGKAKFVEIMTGIADQKQIEVTSGLQVGDSVISGPYRVLRTIKDGDLVKVIHESGDGKEGKS
ncbi:MAG: efflux RND transporter periplasmic adaptor subunit [candidate division Zixibacteria bacterium]|nr:efflux RND transporter periplasmic adaptor subunit [candidate division Zixibacteria bacterium]